MRKLSVINDLKKRVATSSAKLVKSGQIVGLGSGSTANYMIKEVSRRIHEEHLKISAIPTSKKTEKLAKKYSIPLTTLEEHCALDIAIDGADQVDPKLNLIKGLGGALTREKIVGRAAKMYVIIVDETKLAPQLGVQQVVPIEVVPFAIAPVISNISKLGGKAQIRLLKNKQYFITDNHNNIIDVDFGTINDLKRLERQLKMIPGVVETGLFLNMANIVLIGTKAGVKRIERG